MHKHQNTIIIAAVLVAAVFAFALGNPHSLSWPLKCPLYWITGYQCPFCGSQRSVHDLVCGDFRGAWRMNAAFVVLLPYLLMLLAGQAFPKLQKRNWVICFCYRNSTVLAVIIFMIIWGIIRNFFNLNS